MGNAVPCSQADNASQYAAYQSELENAQGATSNPNGTAPVTNPASPSTGSAPVSAAQYAVPNVVGDDTATASALLRAFGFVPAVQGSGTVTQQNPAAFSQAQFGQQITLSAGSGTQQAAPAQQTLPTQAQLLPYYTQNQAATTGPQLD
jgi:beta-lactam-binding protein with PASTA domain